jgi:hypothetical protein
MREEIPLTISHDGSVWFRRNGLGWDLLSNGGTIKIAEVNGDVVRVDRDSYATC